MDATMSRDRRFAFGLLYGLDTSGSVGRLTSGTCNPVSESVTTRDSGGVRPRGVHLPRNGMNHPLVKGHEGVPVGGQVVSLCADS